VVPLDIPLSHAFGYADPIVHFNRVRRVTLHPPSGSRFSCRWSLWANPSFNRTCAKSRAGRLIQTLGASALELIFAGVAAIIILAIGLVVYEVYEKYCQHQNGKQRSFFLYFIGIVFSGFFGGALVNALVLNYACSGNSGAGCSFGVGALLFPFAIAIGIAAFLFIWANSGSHDSKN
jgi:hypothetical protein